MSFVRIAGALAAAGLFCTLAAPSHAGTVTSIAEQNFDDETLAAALIPGGEEARAWDQAGTVHDGSGLGWLLSGADPQTNGDKDLIGVLAADGSGLSHGRDIPGGAGMSGGVLYMEDLDTPLRLSLDAVPAFGFGRVALGFSFAVSDAAFGASDGIAVVANGVEIASWYGDALRTLAGTTTDFVEVALDLSAFADTVLSLEFLFESDAEAEDYAIDWIRIEGTPSSLLAAVPAPPAFELGLAALLALAGAARLRRRAA